VEPYREGKVRLTRAADGSVFVIYLADKGETRLPAYVSMTTVRPAPGATVSLVGAHGALEWEASGTGFVARIPEALRDDPPGEHAWAFRISAVADGR
jgi:alpha-L-fucosidase